MQSVLPKNFHIVSITDAFLRVHWDGEKPLLLGYSGGIDSSALLLALLACGVTPHLAHVDHGWRKESRQEAQMLQEKAEKLGCPFFTTRLSLKERSEDEARRERYRFFASLAPSYSALVLAHQAEDLAETVLKRVLEGAHLNRLGGMQKVSMQYGMKILRPFLEISKKEIEQFLIEKGENPLYDPTNDDPAFLRARMRAEMFPQLETQFGKQIVKNLGHLSTRSWELEEYLEEKSSSVPILKGPWGQLVDLHGVAPLEQRHILQKMAKKEGETLPRPLLEELITELQKKEKERQWTVRKLKIFLSSGRIWMQSFDL